MSRVSAPSPKRNNSGKDGKSSSIQYYRLSSICNTRELFRKPGLHHSEPFLEYQILGHVTIDQSHSFQEGYILNPSILVSVWFSSL